MSTLRAYHWVQFLHETEGWNITALTSQGLGEKEDQALSIRQARSAPQWVRGVGPIPAPLVLHALSPAQAPPVACEVLFQALVLGCLLGTRQGCARVLVLSPRSVPAGAGALPLLWKRGPFWPSLLAVPAQLPPSFPPGVGVATWVLRQGGWALALAINSCPQEHWAHTQRETSRQGHTAPGWECLLPSWPVPWVTIQGLLGVEVSGTQGVRVQAKCISDLARGWLLSTPMTYCVTLGALWWGGSQFLHSQVKR